LIGPFIADDAVRQDLMAALGDHDDRTILEASRCVHQHDASDWIDQIDVPTAVIVTQRDQVIAPEAQRRLAGLIPGSVTLEIPDGHLLPFTDPEMTALFALDACDLVAHRARRPVWHRLLDYLESLKARRHSMTPAEQER
jgi:pimeloyl-ACP methyl ester carboxylesterase